MRKNPWLILLLVAGLAWLWWSSRTPTTAVVDLPTVSGQPDARSPAPASAGPRASIDLPDEALETIALIQRGGPYPHRQDDGVFGNRERRLPQKPRGWYREYTVDTPGVDHRGARRIVTGGNPPSEWYYSDDHYDSFRPREVRR